MPQHFHHFHFSPNISLEQIKADHYFYFYLRSRYEVDLTCKVYHHEHLAQQLYLNSLETNANQNKNISNKYKIH